MSRTGARPRRQTASPSRSVSLQGSLVLLGMAGLVVAVGALRARRR